MSRFRKRYATVAAVVVLMSLCGVLFGDVVCRYERIEDCDDLHAKAKRVIEKAETTDLKSCEVYIGQKNGFIYAHSNYITNGYEHPTKLAADKLRKLFTITANLVLPPKTKPTADTIEKIQAAHEAQIKYYLDQSLFDSKGGLILDLQGAERCYLLFGGSPPPKPLVKVNGIRGPPFVAEFHPSLFVRVTSSAEPEKLFTKLQSRPFKAQETKFTNLIADSKVHEAIERSEVSKVWDKSEITTTDGLRDYFKRNKGRVVTVLGHIDGEKFVVADVKGTTLFEVALVEVERMAEDAGCDAILLGCASAKSGTPIGVARPFNPLDAVELLGLALKKRNYFEFVQTLANKDIGLVFADSAFDRTARPKDLPTRVEADVFIHERGTTNPIERPDLVGRVIMIFTTSGGGGGSNGGGGGGDDDRRNGGGQSGGSSAGNSSANGGSSSGTASPVVGATISTGIGKENQNSPQNDNSGASNLWWLALVAVVIVVAVILYRNRGNNGVATTTGNSAAGQQRLGSSPPPQLPNSGRNLPQLPYRLGDSGKGDNTKP